MHNSYSLETSQTGSPATSGCLKSLEWNSFSGEIRIKEPYRQKNRSRDWNTKQPCKKSCKPPSQSTNQCSHFVPVSLSVILVRPCGPRNTFSRRSNRVLNLQFNFHSSNFSGFRHHLGKHWKAPRKSISKSSEFRELVSLTTWCHILSF